MKTCYAIMPFEASFSDIDRIVGEAARECDLQYVRSDRRLQPGSVMAQVVRDIRAAAVIVADITRNNPNVFYELGIAHQIKGPERVLLITQAVAESPYDVNEFQQLTYTHTEAGRDELRRRLPDLLRTAIASVDQEVWDVVRGRLQRTKLLVRDLRRLADSAGPHGLEGWTIRIAATFGSLAISEHEGMDSASDREYFDALIAERNTLRDVLLKGARLKAVLNPPRPAFSGAPLPRRLVARYQRLILLLEGRSDIQNDPKGAAADVEAVKQCDFVLSPVPMPNLFIIGESVAYEGMKRGGSSGFEMTHCETSPSALRELIDGFDRFFERTRTAMAHANPQEGHLPAQVRKLFESAVAEYDPTNLAEPT
jgi:hypothetical protein